jgi:DNA transposition AAA+ family ATPase
MSEIEQSEEARAASAHSRINMPLNLHAWKDVDDKFHADLLWFHQHVLDEGMGWDDITKAIGYERSSVFKFLKGYNEGSYENFCKAIKSYKTLWEKRRTIQQVKFEMTPIAELIFATLDYALANNSMTMIVGNSCMGKSTCLQEWRSRNNHGTSVYVDCPPAGGVKGFLGAIAGRVGVGRNLPIPEMLAGVTRSLNANRILLLDNMHRAMPADPRSGPKCFDIVQHIFDETGCAIAVTATDRLDGALRSSAYMFEQFYGRIGTPVYLPATPEDQDWLPILKQFVSRPSRAVVESIRAVALGEGRLRQVVERLKLASRIAGKAKEPINEEHIFKALRIRETLSRHNTNNRKGRI